MPERGEEFRSIDEVFAAAEHEFQVKLNERGKVHAKAIALNAEAQRQGIHDDPRVRRLNLCLMNMIG